MSPTSTGYENYVLTFYVQILNHNRKLKRTEDPQFLLALNPWDNLFEDLKTDFQETQIQMVFSNLTMVSLSQSNCI